MNLLVGDIGGTHTRLAVYTGTDFTVARIHQNDDYPDPLTLFTTYISTLPAELLPQQARFAVAAPVTSDDVYLTNRAWRLYAPHLREILGLQSVALINDFAAVALGVRALQADGYRKVGEGTAVAQAALLALGPGTGFGMAGLAPQGDHWRVISSEGGHATLSILDRRELEILSHLHDGNRPVAIEEVLSGPGMLSLYRAIADLDGLKVEAETQEAVTQLARNSDKLALDTLGVFFRFLGRAAGDMALTFNAIGGVYLAGGILPKLLAELEASGFRKEFENKGRFTEYVAAIPTFLVTDSLVAFRGLASLA
ncbi:MAG: glucokinase [Gammaproteobacteria bacterium]